LKYISLKGVRAFLSLLLFIPLFTFENSTLAFISLHPLHISYYKLAAKVFNSSEHGNVPILLHFVCNLDDSTTIQIKKETTPEGQAPVVLGKAKELYR
jgi:hypothetical protein